MQLDGPGLIHLRRIDRTLRFSVVGLLIIGISWVMRDILLLGFAAVLIATVMRGASDLVQRGTGIFQHVPTRGYGAIGDSERMRVLVAGERDSRSGDADGRSTTPAS